jgi:hypothetical protein
MNPLVDLSENHKIRPVRPDFIQISIRKLQNDDIGINEEVGNYFSNYFLENLNG